MKPSFRLWISALTLTIATCPTQVWAQNSRATNLSDLDLSKISTGFGQVHRSLSVDGKPLSIAGQKFSDGLGVHANSAAYIDLAGTALKFTASVGVDDEVAGHTASVEFIVSADGKTLWKSGLMRAGDAAKPVDLNVQGVKLLKLEVSDGGNGVDYDHADWGDARLTYTGTAPQTVRDPGQIWIEAGLNKMAFRVGRNKELTQIYFGSSDTPPSSGDNGDPYQPFGGGSLLQPALRATHADGNTSTALEFVNKSIQKLDDNVTQTRIELKDPGYPFFVSLIFKAYVKENVIEQWSEIRHQETGPVELYQFASAAPFLGQGQLYLTQFHGGWANEMNREENKLSTGVQTLESHLGTRAALNLSPSFLVSVGAPAQQNTGDIIGATLAYSGNFQFQFETDGDNRVRAICGINPYNSQYRLAPGELFTTPSMIWSRSNQGSGQLSRQFQSWGRQYGMRDGNQVHDVLLNNWETTFFDFDEQKLLSLFDGAKDLGMELFLLDDGWFGNKYPRDGDNQGLGDWQPMEKKLPHGLSFLTDEAKKRGIRFGIWLEPEMVNPRSELFEKHPDWVIHQPKRELALERNQAVLDLSNPQVREWMFDTVDGILTKNPGISYVKWDCNRFISQPGSSYLKADEQTHLYIDYVRAYYDVLARLAKKHPNVQLMNCASGGGRADYGALRMANEFWPSDNTDPLRRVRTQWDYEQFFPTAAISAHVTGWGNRPLKFGLDVAMSARLGMDLDVNKLSPEDKTFARNAVATYKGFRDVVQLGDLYQMESPYENARVSQLYASPDKKRAVLFAWQIKDGAPARLNLQGLDPKQRYLVKEANLRVGQTSQVAENGQILEGAQLMKSGLALTLSKQFDSSIVELTARN